VFEGEKEWVLLDPVRADSPENLFKKLRSFSDELSSEGDWWLVLCNILQLLL